MSTVSWFELGLMSSSQDGGAVWEVPETSGVGTYLEEVGH